MIETKLRLRGNNLDLLRPKEILKLIDNNKIPDLEMIDLYRDVLREFNRVKIWEGYDNMSEENKIIFDARRSIFTKVHNEFMNLMKQRELKQNN